MQSLRQKQIDEVLEYHDRINRDVFEREKKHVWNSGLQTSIPNRQDLTIEAEVKSKVQNILYDIQNITQSIHYLPSEEMVALAAITYSLRPKRAGPRGPRGPSEEKEPEGELKESKSESDTSSLDSGSDLDSDSDRPGPGVFGTSPFKQGYSPLSRPVREEHPEGYEEDPEEFRRYSKQINEKNLARIKSGKESFDNIFRFLTKVIRDWNNLVDYFNLKMRQQNYTGTEQNNFLSSVKTLVEPLKNALSKIVLLKTQTQDYFKLYNTLDNMLQLVEAAPPLNYIPHDILSTTVPDPGLVFGANDSTVRLAKNKLTEYATRVADISLLVPTTAGEKESIDRLLAWYKGEGAKLQKLINRTRTPNPASHLSAVANIVRFFGTTEESFRQAQNNILRRLGRREREGKVVKELFSKHPSSEVGEDESLSDPTLPSYRRGRVGSESSSGEETELSEEEEGLVSANPPGAAARAEFEEINSTQPQPSLRFPTTQSFSREYSGQVPSYSYNEEAVRRLFPVSPTPSEYNEGVVQRVFNPHNPEEVEQVPGRRELFRDLPPPIVEDLAYFRKAVAAATTRSELERIGEGLHRSSLTAAQKSIIDTSIGAKYFSLPAEEFSGQVPSNREGKGKRKKGGAVPPFLEPYITKGLKPNKFNGVSIGGAVKKLNKKQLREKKELLEVPLEDFQVELLTRGLGTSPFDQGKSTGKKKAGVKPLQLPSADQEGLWFL